MEHLHRIRRVTIIGIVVNVLLSILKIVVGSFAGSQALLADGFHSVSDLVSDAAILIGSKFWLCPPDEAHPYGHGRIETIVNIVIGTLLLSAGIGIGWNSIKTLGIEHTAPPSWIAFWVALLSIIMKEFVYRITLREGKQINSAAVIANAWHHRSDALSSIPVAASVIGAKINPDLIYLDHIAALVVTLMIVKASYDIIMPSLKELTEFRADYDLENKIILLSKEIPEIKEIHKIRSRKIGSSILMDFHMLFPPEMSIDEAHNIAEQFNKQLLQMDSNLTEIIIHIEPFHRDS